MDTLTKLIISKTRIYTQEITHSLHAAMLQGISNEKIAKYFI